MLKFLINVEAQKSSDSNKLQYHLDNRIIYYLARMISAQKEVEFEKSNYDDIKPVRSICICMDANDDEDYVLHREMYMVRGWSYVPLIKCRVSLYALGKNLMLQLPRII